MGNKLGLSASPVTVHSSSSSVDIGSSPQRYAGRKRSVEEAGGDHNVEDIITPRTKRSKKTSDYIYETLYRQGQDSDIVIKALGITACCIYHSEWPHGN